MATNGGNIVVPVGVQLELQNVQEIIANLQKAMSNVKPETKGYSNIVSELSKAEKRADALASKLKQGFTTNAGIQSFTKGFEDLIAMVDAVNTKVGQINFDNLNLTADQQAQMETFVNNIQAAKDAYNSFETGKIKEAVNASQTLQDIFSKLNLKVDTTSLDTAISSMKAKIAELQKQIDAEEKKAVSNETRAANRQSEIDELNRLKKLFTSQDLGKDFPEFFRSNGSFKSGGNKALTDLLEKLGLDNDTIELVKKTAGSKIKEIQDELEKAINTRIKTKEGQRNTASDNAKAARDIADQLVAQQKEVIDAEKAMDGLKNDNSIVNARKQETDQIAEENAKIREFIELIQKAFRGNLGKNSNDLKAALDNVRASGGAAAAELANLEQRSRTIDNVKRSISMWMGFNQVLRLSRTAIRNIIKDIRDLDKVMTQIAVVTNMTQSDLWNQMNTYQNIAKQYGVATTGVYQVSQIYYQQGLQTSEVMNLTNETLKMAKIAGLDYSKAADYMTVAIRGFKMEMTDAQNVVDVYSNLAAKSASNTTELATAMSKTASSAAAVGSSFENTSAMIAMMVETTRESAENIGSALKSIISRYGEMTSDPSKLVDSEGEALSLNKVDKALQSIGISLHDAQGQFRDFDDVILELSSKWDTLDKNSQRYIATIMAGNRQQSRFLALVSDYDRLSELSEEAANAEDAALAQTLKTMDSLETKIQNVKNAFQGFYANLGLEEVFKGALDIITNIVNRLNSMPKVFGKIPIAAIGMVANIVNVIKTLGMSIITTTTAHWQQISEIIKENIARGFREGADQGAADAEKRGAQLGQNLNKKNIGIATAGRAISTIGTLMSTSALTIGDDRAKERGGYEIGGGILTGLGQGIATGAMVGGPWGAALGGITGVISALPSLAAGINDVTHAEELRIKAMRESVEKSNQEAVLAKSEARNLENTIEKVEKLSAAKNESNEAYQEWLDYVNQIASDYPELISMYDSEGNAVINMAEAYEKLAQSRTKAAQASLDAQIDSLKTQQAEIKRIQKIANESIAPDNAGDKLGKGLSNISGAFVDENGNLNIGLNSNEIVDIAKDYLTDIFEEISTYGEDQGRVSQFKLKASGIDAVQNWTAEDFGGSEENLEIARNAMADLFYEQFIKPLAKEGYLSDIGFENEEDIQKLVEGWDPEDIVQKYLDIMSQINETVQSNAELEEKVGELEEKKRSADLALQKWAENNISVIDGFSKEKVSKFSGDSFMQTILEKNMPEEYITNNGFNAAGQNIINDLFDFYNQIDEDTYKEITSILANPENYTSKLDLRAALAQTLGNDELTEKLIEYITKTGEDGTSYLTDIWEKQVESLRNKFQSNLSGSKQNKNPQIQEAIDKILKVGNGKIRNGSDLEGEIAAQYLNDINKQWTDLVTKQKNEVVATQNAEFLADTYLNVSELSEEANGAMANILSTAELNTREGIQNAIDQIEQYQATNEVSSDDAAKLESILANLRQHKADLLLNLNTEIQSYVDSLSDAIESISKNYSNNISGISKLSDANEILQKINNRKIKTGEEQLNFSDVFTFDKTLGKYVFTIKGLIEANNQVIKDLDSQYEDTIDQLNQEKDTFSEITSKNGLGSDIQKNKGDKTKVINALKKASKNDNYTDEQQSYLADLAIRYEQSNKEWDIFIESEQKRLDQLGINIDQAHEAMLKMTVEAQQREAFKAIDFSAIANGSQSFEEAKQSFLNYYATQINQDLPEWLQNIQMNLAKVTSKVAFNAIKMGGQGGLNMYRLLAAVTGQETDKNTENEIYNARVKAISSLHNKMQKATGQERIQLDDAERTVLGVTSNDIGATELAEKYSQLIDEVRQGVKNGQTDIETANAAIIDEEFSDELSLDKQTSALASIGTSKITPESIKTLANTIGVLSDLPDDFDIKQLKGLNKEGFITDINEFLNSFNDLLVNKLTGPELDNIASSLELADKSKIIDAAVQAENSIIESIASEINSIKSAGIDKKVNLTYLTNKLGSDSLNKIFESAYSDGILTVNEAVKANMYNSLNEIRSELKAKGDNTDDLTETIIGYMDAAISDFNDFSGAFDVSDETAQLLASKSSIFKNQLITTGKIAINSVEHFAMAANAIYNEVSNQYQKGLANLTKLNSSYANVVKSNLAKQTAGFNMLTSASKIDLTSLQNFLNVYNKKLSDYVDKMGNLTTAGATAGLKSLGNGNYQIADWHKFINQLQITANELSTEYIDAYVSWLESDANVAPNAKEALMTSLIPNMDKLTYAQIGQIAKTFNATVDQILTIIGKEGDNGNGTFNGGNLVRLLNFDKTNEEFARALSTQLQSVTSNMTSAMITFVEAGADGKRTNLDFSNLKNAISDFEKGMQALGQNVSVQNLVRALTEGGETAVAAAEQIAALSGQELSASDIETLYRGQVGKLVNAIDTVVAQPGEIVDAVTASIISQSGGQVNQLGTTGQYVVESAANLYEAYNNLLQRMVATGEATLSDLNQAAALALENRKTGNSTASEQYIIDALGDAANMTYTRFGEILASAGYRLSETLVKDWSEAGIIKDFGGSKMAITDFSKFADAMGWEAGSEEYTSAFKTYNDSLIQMNRQAERNILEEVSNIGEAKGGDWINLTQIMDKMRKGFATLADNSDAPSLEVISQALSASLAQYGAKIESGILKLDEDANIPMVFQTIADNVINYGELSANETAQLLDTIKSVLENYANLISSGIEGTLDNTGAEQLKQFASGFGIKDLTFSETAKGLKVSTTQAYKLYQAIKKIDALQGNMVFDKLAESLRADKGGDFSSASKTMAAVARVEQQIEKNQQKVNEAREKGMGLSFQEWQLLEKQNAKLREKKSLYEDIQKEMAFSNMDNPESFDFMDQDLPKAMQGPINYWDSVGKAFAAMNEAGQTGKMAIQDFYNIVNEMNNLIALTGNELVLAGVTLDGSAEAAAALIQKGMGSLTNIDGKGVKVNLENLGIDFVSGAEGAKNNFHSGVQALAKSQVEMLDAAIKVLEIIVAMENLGNIDVDGNNVFSIGDIFQLDANGGLKKNKDGLELYTKEYQDFAEDLLKQAEANEDLNKALEDVKINGITMKELFKDAANGIKNVDLDAESYFKVMDAFVKAAQSGDWDLDNIFESVKDIINSSFPDGMTVDVGDKTFVISGGTVAVIDWADANISEIVDNIKQRYDNDEEKAKQAVIDSVTKANNGTASRTDVLISLAVDEKVEIIFNEDGEPQIKGPDGEPIDPNSKEGMKIIAEKALERAGVDKITGYKYTSDNKIIGTAEVKIGTSIRLVSTDSEGNIVYHSGITGQDYNSQQEMINAEVEKVRQQLAENGENISYGEAYERLYHIPYKVNTSVDIDFSDEQAVEKAKQLLEENKQDIIDKLNNSGNKDFTYTHNTNGTITFNMDGVTATVADTGNLEKDLDSALNDIATKLQYNDLVTGIQTGIENAFSGDVVSTALTNALSAALSGAKEIPVGEDTQPEVTGLSFNAKDPKIAQISGTPTYEGTGEGITPPEVSGIELIAKDPIIKQITGTPTINSGEGNVANEVPIPQVVLQPSSMTIDIAQAGQPTLSNTAGTRDLVMEEVILKPNNVKLNVDGLTPTLEGGTDSTGTSKPIQAGDVTLVPGNVSLDVSTKKPTLKGAEDNTAIDSDPVTLKPSNVTLDVSSKKPEISGDMQDAELDTLAAKVGTIDASSSKAPAIKKDGMPTATIDTLDATVTTINATAETVDASGAATSIADDIRAKLEGEEFKVKIGLELDLGDNSGGNPNKTDTPDVGDGGLSGLAKAISDLTNAASGASGPLGDVKTALTDVNSEEIVNASKATTDARSSELVNASKATTDAKSAEMSNAMHAINDTQATKVVTATGAINNINTTPATNARAAINGISSTGASKAKEAINSIDSGPARNAKSALNSISVNLPSSRETDVTLRYKVSKTSAKGNIGNFAKAKGSGPAKVGGSTKTLMGELGPELVVSNGRYFIAGANGAEFVDLANDAIVFNHLQTRRLMSQGAIGGRGRPTTNEREAVAFAKGKVPSFGPARETGEDQDSKQQAQEKRESEKITSVSVSPPSKTFHNLVQFKSRAKGTGPAMASAAEALALLKQLRAMWQSLADASLADMGGNAGRGGGGGGGGSDNDEDRKNYYAGINESIDRWYNWLKKIEDTQIRINKLTKEYNLLEKEGLSTEEKLANLQDRQKSLKSNKETRDQLVKEQKDVRADLINSANKGLFSAFYEADPKTGLISLKNDESFVNFLKATDDNGSNKELIKQIKDGQSIKNKEITRKYSDTELKEIGARKFDNFNLKETINAKQLKGLSKTQKKFYEKTTDKNGKTVYKLKSDARENYAEAWKNSQRKNNKDNKSITLTRDIKTGLDFISELQATDEAGNLIHDAADQLSLIKAMGLWTEDLELGIDKEQDGWEQQVVERFFGKIDQDKSDIEGLTDSINEQEEASLDDAIAIQEINDQIRELLTPVTGVTDGLTKWYNETQKIKTAQAEINKLTKELSILQNDFEAKGFEIFKNYKDQEDSLNRQTKINEGLLDKRRDLVHVLTNKYSGLINKGIISVDEKGTATFSDSKVNKGEIQTSYQKIVTNGQGYQIDEEGKYVDDKGVLRDKEGKEITDENAHFGTLQYEKVDGKSYDTTGKSFEEIIEDITSQNALGEVAYNAEEQYQILKSLGLEDFMKYDEKGNQIYDDFGELNKEDMQKAVEAGIKRIQGSVEEINENNDEMTNLEQEQLEIQSQLQSIQKALIDNQIEVENLVKDAVVQEHQDAIDAKKAFTDAISDAASKTIEGMRKDLDNEKQTYESDKDNKELTLLRMQLTTAQMSGSSVSKIRDLQKQIQDKQQEMYYNEREKLINELEDQTNETVEALNEQTEIAQTALDYQVKYGGIWEEVNEKLAKSPEALVDFISKNQPDFLSKSETERKTLLTNILKKIQTFSSDIKYQELSDERDTILSNQKYSDARFGNEDIKNEILKAGQEIFKNTDGSLEEKTAAAKKAMQDKADSYLNTFANQDKASEVTNQINSLGDITSLDQESSVKSARSAYDSLGEAKSYVSQETLDKLIAAENKINELKQPKIEQGEEGNPPTTGGSETSDEPVKEETGEETGGGEKPEISGGTPPPTYAWAITDDWEKNKNTKKIAAAIKKISPTYGLDALHEKINELYNINQGNEAKTFEALNKLNTDAKLKSIVKKYRNKHNKWPIYTTSKKIKYYSTAKDALNNTNSSGTIKAGAKIPFVAISKNKRKTDKAQILKGKNGKFYPYLSTTGKLTKQIEIPQFAKGGDIDFTGIAQVDGTKSKPEHIFNFEQMEALRAHLLSGIDTTARAVAGLSNIIESLPNVNTYNNINNDNSGININNIEFHMEVKEISNDYDARRAGQQAMEEMVRIAYKAGNRSISRR